MRSSFSGSIFRRSVAFVRFLFCLPFRTAPLPDELTRGEAVVSLARAAEQAGFGAIGCSEHPAPAERWRQSGGHDALDPYVTLAVAAAATSRIRLVTYSSPLPYRNPFLLAKSAATLDRLSGGRFTLGVSAGYLRGEFSALGADYDRRGALVDQALAVLPLAWSGQPVDFEGEGFSARAITCQPRPVQVPHPPIWVGGNGRAARRRAASIGNGWMPMPLPIAPASDSDVLTSPEQLPRLIDELREFAVSHGRPGSPDVVYPARLPADATFAQYVDFSKRLEQFGVTWAVVNVGAQSVAATAEWLLQFGAEVISASATQDADSSIPVSAS
jgi:probable F420-dependent oxidoreductase